MNAFVPYEDHIQASELLKVGVPRVDAECFVCGTEWPCEKTLAYNDGLNHGTSDERARIATAVRETWGDINLAGAIERGEL